MKFPVAALLVLAIPDAQATGARLVLKNPIRKVVNMLQDMEKKAQEKDETAKKLFDEFQCQCKSTKQDLTTSIATAEQKLASLPSDIEEAEKKLVQVKEGVKKAKSDRAAAKNALAEAKAIREKESKDYINTKDEFEVNIRAIGKAVKSIEGGAAAAFLETGMSQVLERAVTNQKDMDEDHRDTILSFLSGESAGSNEVTGILKELGDEMSRNLAQVTSEEEESIRIFNGLVAAKTKEINACAQAVEDKTNMIGELGIEIVEMKDDQKDSEKSFGEDKKFLVELEKNCAAKTAEFEKESKSRGEELLAIADTIKLLNSDASLELFKKALPAASSSFLQVAVTAGEMRRRAISAVRQARDAATKRHRTGFGLIALALTGKKVSFDKVGAMIDDMVKVLQSEQDADDRKKSYCETEFDETEDKLKGQEREIAKAATNVDKAKDAIATLDEEISKIELGLRQLDRSVTRATMQRQKENRAFNSMMTQNTAVKQLLGFAKKRLTQSFLQVTSESSSINKVVAMFDAMMADMDKEMTEGKAGEKEAQSDYEVFTQDAKVKRATDRTLLEFKLKVKADSEDVLGEHKTAHSSATDEHTATEQFAMSLHSECDWLMQEFMPRKTAREGEIDSLKKAKDVLNGADFSFLQTSSRNLRLRRR